MIQERIPKEAEFWNDPRVVEVFYSLPPKKYWKDFLGRFKNPAEVRVLDLGCGGGRNTELLLKMGFNSWACDLHKEMVAASKQRISKLFGEKNANKIVLASMLNLPFRSGYFDVVVSSGVYHNTRSIGEFQKAIRETSRVLKTGGFLCLNVFYKGRLPRDFKKIKSKKYTYLTRNGLFTTLLPRKKFLEISRNSGFIPVEKLVSYESGVLTGKRSVLRGVLKKAK